MVYSPVFDLSKEGRVTPMKILIPILLVFSVLIIGCNSDNTTSTRPPDQTPTIANISPTSFARGEHNVDMTITGTNLTGVTVVGLGDGTTVHSASAANATTINVKLSIQRLAVPGNRSVSVTTPHGTAVATNILRINGDAPEANFTFEPKDISQNSDVSFDGSSSFDADGSIRDYAWDFGDGKRASGKLVTHKFNAGNYNVSLTVTDNDNQKNAKDKPIVVQDRVEIKCTNPAGNNGFLGGNIVGVEDKYAIIQLQKNRTCANSFYLCGDMRLDDPEIFRGIISEMYFLGDGKFKVKNDCPYRWPPTIGEFDVLIFKTCSNNHCP
jgi:hypothetical protein